MSASSIAPEVVPHGTRVDSSSPPATSNASRREELLLLAEAARREYEAWMSHASDTPPTTLWWNSLTTLINAFVEGEFPASLKGAISIVHRFVGEFIIHVNAHGDVWHKATPHDEFMRLLGDLHRYVEGERRQDSRRENPNIETVEELIGQGVSDRQILAMYHGEGFSKLTHQQIRAEHARIEMNSARATMGQAKIECPFRLDDLYAGTKQQEKSIALPKSLHQAVAVLAKTIENPPETSTC